MRGSGLGRTPTPASSRATERSVAPALTSNAYGDDGKGNGRCVAHHQPAAAAQTVNRNRTAPRRAMKRKARMQTSGEGTRGDAKVADYNRAMNTRQRHSHPLIGSPRGFTLIEIMVVIVILGILAALVV